MSTALRALPSPVAPGLIRLASAAVACDVQRVPAKARDTSAIYELALANEAPVSVLCRLYGVDEHAQSRDFGVLEVAGRSLGRSRFAVPFDARNRYERVYVEVVGDGIRLLAEAQSVRAYAARRPWAAPLLFVLGALVATLGALTALESPAVVALGVPHAAPPGFVTVSYAVRGHAATTYRAATSHGTVLASGALPSSSGNIAFVVPDGAVGQSVRVTLDARGPLGHVSRSAAFDVGLPAHAAEPAAAQVRALTAHRETYAGRQSVLASYSAVGERGTLRVLDAQGTVVGSAPFTHVGTSRIALDRDTSSETLRAELVVNRGDSRADAAVELPADGTENALAARASAMAVAVAAETSKLNAIHSPAPSSGNAALAGTTSAASVGDPFAVNGRVIAGQPFGVAIRRRLPRMRIALQDETGTALQEQVVPADANELQFAVPQATVAQTYYLACTFMRGTSEETLVRSVRIFPH